MDARKRFLCSFLLILVATAAPMVSAAQTLRVNEAATRIHPLGKGLEVSLVLDNSGPLTSGHASLELILRDDRVRAAGAARAIRMIPSTNSPPP
ncbi:MAG TPA: hypothetical protein VGR03_17580 [Candidatus Acidoferrum sp.]|nr:hypothetical protein [Candidatus Acidoferrum sp.]